MDTVRKRVAAASLVVLGISALAACGSRSGEATVHPYAGVPAGTMLVSTGSAGAWLQTKRLDGTRARDVTRKVARYEARSTTRRPSHPTARASRFAGDRSGIGFP